MSFSKSWNCTSRFLSIIQTWKNLRRKIAGRCFLKPFFRIREIFFQSFRTKFLSLLYMISLAFKISHCLSANHYPELRCVICTGVTLFAPVLHFLSFPFTLLCLFTILFLHMFICNLLCQLFYVFPVICYIKTRPDAKFSIVPEEGWFGQPKYSTRSKKHSTLCRFLPLYSYTFCTGVTLELHCSQPIWIR